MAYSLGWKDILRPIRDGYRHLFPAPDTGPTPEERSKRREEDRLKGFTYFDTFEQLEAWTIHETDPLQRANIPLLRRCISAEVEGEKANVLLCHDYAGNYHDYESAQEPGLKEEMYSCDYLQFVDTFVYFSHKLVCVPPPTWTNTLHRNGVKALGAIILEPQAKETERLLQQLGGEDGNTFRLAHRLAGIAKYHGFDGYLVNIEKPFPNLAHIARLQAFLSQLKNNLGEYGDHMQLLWYDALTTSNRVSYQNALTASNLPFAEACGSMLTNYCWDVSGAKSSKTLATKSELDAAKVYFGIDVWAQNGGRTTYPEKGGGGTNTGVAVAKVCELGLSAGVFAPAWSFEHFPSHGKGIEKVVWEGGTLPSGIECSCGDAVARHQPTHGVSIIQHARFFPAGSDLFFYTNFSRAFSKYGEDASLKLRTQLGLQSILPLPPPLNDRDLYRRLSHRLDDYHDHTKLTIEARDGPSTEDAMTSGSKYWLPLYKLNMPADGTLRIKVACRNPLSIAGPVPSLYLKFSGDRQPQLLPIRHTIEVSTVTTNIGAISDAELETRLEELGVYFGGFSGARVVDVLEISSVVIAPVRYHYPVSTTGIFISGFKHGGQGDNATVRLYWYYSHDNEAMVSGIPFGALTGPFSHFVVNLDNTQIGRAYALECIVPQDLVDRISNNVVKAEITGIGFDGRTLANKSAYISMSPNGP
ncbi:hypothetical protein CC86DRAFT_29912 [Ophiobolus disseminans]|uniref:Cytosolic endo-beta-N-acetylglucosaminidase TIM barrel domain-containing protein n=1 Tax=Ophiobolus disseminans TaxID=1469910 RepID=A0A6A7A168_9PLEO|nr:hypothetical protein CC86DRAFT_29912 [Ophiobolus disseminans]